MRPGYALVERDMAVRLGGDEFVVLLRGGAATATQVAERQLRVVARPMMLPGQTCSMGIAVIGRQIASERDPNAVLSAADDAMYQAKRGGKGWYVLAD